MHEMQHDAGDAGGWPTLLTTKDVQSLMRVDRSTIYRMAETGRLPAIKVGRQWRFPEDRLHRWLNRREAGVAGAAETPVAELRDLVAPGPMQALTSLLADLLGVMVLVTDMAGQPLAEVANPCGLFAAAHRHPGVMEHCITGWREMADEPDLDPQWKPTPLGFLCARTLVRVGAELKGMVLVGGVAPAEWPPAPAEVEHLAAGLTLPPDLLSAHVDEVYRLTAQEQERVLRLLPRVGAFISRLAGSEAPRPPAESGQRSDQ